MVRRRGIGATAVAAVVFSVMLVSNAALFSAAQDRARLYAVAASEGSQSVTFSVLSSSETLDELASVQRALSAGPLQCTSAIQVLSREVAASRESESANGVTVTATAAMWTGRPSSDNMTSVAPFEGAEEGALNIAVTASAKGGVPGQGVTYSKVETHLVHLPVRASQEAAECEGAAELLDRSVQGTEVANCTAGTVLPLMDRVERNLTSAASEAGFTLLLTYTFGSTPACTVTFQVLVTQPGVQGPAGVFHAVMEEGGSVSFAAPVQPQQG